jgi:hypothetical protein
VILEEIHKPISFTTFPLAHPILPIPTSSFKPISPPTSNPFNFHPPFQFSKTKTSTPDSISFFSKKNLKNPALQTQSKGGQTVDLENLEL